MTGLLARTVRLHVAPGQRATPGTNTWSAVPDAGGVGATYALTAICTGPMLAYPGMVINITEIDEAIRTHAPGPLTAALASSDADPASTLIELGPVVATAVSRPLVSLTWALSPWHRIIWETSSMHAATLVREYHFAAAHRLFDPALDEATNEATFGKCARAGGHGHNYKLEVHVGIRPGGVNDLTRTIDGIVEDRVLERFDHRHLNNECEEFKDLNPTVENIAMVCWTLLEDSLTALGTPRQVRVWETERTWAAYPADPMPVHDAP